MSETTELNEFDIFEDQKTAKLKLKNYQDLMALCDSYEMNIATKGSVVKATYKGLSGEQHVFYVRGFKDSIRVENRPSESKYLTDVSIGDVVDVLISKVDNINFFIKGSISALYESRAHENLKSLEEGYSVSAFIKSLNPAGYEIQIQHGGVTIPGFMPNTLAGINKLYNPESIVGQTFEVMIESFSEKEGTYIVSRRKYLQSLIPDMISKLETGAVYTGIVTGTTPFGVFVEFNDCLTGMIHKLNLGEDWQNRISEIKPGFEIEFYIKEVIKERGNRFKIILTQILRESLWDNIKNGQIIEGTVKDTKVFGTLVNLDGETVGLIHSSELSKFNKKFTNGQSVKVKVLSIDRTSRKIFLTLP